MNKSVNVLGTVYMIIRATEEEEPGLKGLGGFIDSSVKEIYIAIATPSQDTMKDLLAVERCSLRHEITHAFMTESGLVFDSLVYEGGWAKNEEMIDWFARQGPKIYEAWMAAGAI